MSEVKKFLYEKDEDGEVVAHLNPAWAKQQQNQKYDLYLKKSDIPTFYYDINFEDYQGDKDSNEYQSILKYAENISSEKLKNVNLYLWGIHSCQKTALSCNILKSAIRQGLRVKFILAGTLIDKLMKCQGYGITSDLADEVEDIKSHDVICIDDIFDINKSLMWRGESRNLIIIEWDTFLRNVLSNGKKIILTSNYSLEAIHQHFGESLYELIDRNFYAIQLKETVKQKRKLDVKSALEGL